MAHHYLNFLLVHEPNASAALAQRALIGLYIQHMHTRLLTTAYPQFIKGGKSNLGENRYDPNKAIDCSTVANPAACSFKPPKFFWDDDDGIFWSTAVGACLGTDPVTGHANVCGLDEDEDLLRDVASTCGAVSRSPGLRLTPCPSKYSLAL